MTAIEKLREASHIVARLSFSHYPFRIIVLGQSSRDIRHAAEPHRPAIPASLNGRFVDRDVALGGNILIGEANAALQQGRPLGDRRGAAFVFYCEDMQVTDSMINQQAVPFEVMDANGTTHRLSDGLGRWQLLVFHRHLG